MRICGISDLHGNLGFSVKQCDVLCISGDVVPLRIQKNKIRSIEWLANTFVNWCYEQPCKQVLLIGGNHDFAIESDPDAVRNTFKGTKIKYLFDEEFVYEGVKFYGSPWCHKFFDWAFMDYEDDELREKFLEMPEDIDVLLTHDCPHGACDILLQDVYWADGKHIGSIGLADAVVERKPKLMLTGHLHSGNHNCEMMGETKVFNVSMLDERYELVYEPHYFEILEGEITPINYC